jgi:hypothetical protein
MCDYLKNWYKLMMNGAHHMLIKRSNNLLELSQELRILKHGGLE